MFPFLGFQVLHLDANRLVMRDNTVQLFPLARRYIRTFLATRTIVLEIVARAGLDEE
jgi:hypothetical protein